MLAVLCLIAAGQSATAPVLPPGVNGDLHRAFLAVEERLEKGDFAGANSKLALLPDLAIVYKWDDSKVPEAQRKDFVTARDAAFKLWSDRYPGVTFKEGAKPKIKFSFETTLAKAPDSELPRGITLFFSEDPKDTRMEAVIGLKRGEPLEALSETSLQNEVLFSVGSYLGLAPSPFPMSAMGRTNVQMPTRAIVLPTELNLVTAIRQATDKLAKAVEQKQKLTPARPRAAYDPQKIEKGPVIQGTPLPMGIQINNLGNAPLAFQVIPDCGCIAVTTNGVVDPNSSFLVQIKVNTADIAGAFHKTLTLITNDPENPYHKIPIDIKTTPRYRFIGKAGQIAIVDEKGLDIDLYLTTPQESPFEITGIEVVGNPGKATFEPWSGDLADPDRNEPLQKRQGHKIKLHLDEPQISGRSPATVVVQTNDPIFSQVRYTVFAQKGIAVLPSSVYMGEVGKTERRANIVLSRPGKPFKVTKVECDSSFISAVAEPIRDDSEYILKLVYDGKAPIGDLRATITVHTDDPKQSKIRIPLAGLVK